MSSTFFLREFCFVVQSFFKFAEAEWWAMEVKSHAGRVSGASRVSLVQAVRGGGAGDGPPENQLISARRDNPNGPEREKNFCDNRCCERNPVFMKGTEDL